jgi:hypothetical protein
VHVGQRGRNDIALTLFEKFFIINILIIGPAITGKVAVRFMGMTIYRLVIFFLLLCFGFASHAQVCRLSVAGLNRARKVTGPIHAECTREVVHSAPFGNWGVSSNFGSKHDGHQFDGWCHDQLSCDKDGVCRLDCLDGWYEWNSCTDDSAVVDPIFWTKKTPFLDGRWH